MSTRDLAEKFIYENPFIPITPTERQLRFLLSPKREVFFGGAAGGGKSAGLLAAACMYLPIKGYSAIIFRRSYADLSREGALLSVSKEWLTGKAEWSERDHTWRVPGGGVLSFGYLDAERDRYAYQSAEFQGIFFDEVTQLEPAHYTYMHSRLRRKRGARVPLRIWSTGNPGGKGHQFFKDRFITSPTKDREFIPSSLQDNPHVDTEMYLRALGELDPITRARLLDGDWDVAEGAGMFHADDFIIIRPDEVPNISYMVRYWDLAASAPKPGRDPDYTAGVRMGLKDGRFYIVDLKHVRSTPGEVEDLVRRTAEEDGPNTAIRTEEEPGSSGKTVTDHYARHVLVGFDFKGIRSTGNKAARARPFSAATANANVYVVRRHWTDTLIEELSLFPGACLHDDITDGCSGAFNVLAEGLGNYEPSSSSDSIFGDIEPFTPGEGRY
ncbi:MAG: phage terminase large subunit [Actinobacteria bacterium]|nr:phage terminase large subunit [Actinomycetota bacterium]MBU1942917.1 phage terminase large subunit [Actinomycetota bacterium]MBU2687648.1 phage terminase large subunit [Actinomycetota bacterium]